MPGVVAAPADDLAGVGDLPCDRCPGHDRGPARAVLARDRAPVRRRAGRGRPAATAHAAEDTLAAITVSYEALLAVAARTPPSSRTLPSDALPDNIGSSTAAGGRRRPRLRRCRGRRRRRLTDDRVAPAPLEGRVVLSDFDAASGRLDHPHVEPTPARPRARARRVPRPAPPQAAARRPRYRRRVGSRLCFYAEDVISASCQCARPALRLVGARRELPRHHARARPDPVRRGRGPRDRRITGFRPLFADVGAYAIGMGPGVPAISTGLSVSGPYNLPMSRPGGEGLHQPHPDRAYRARGIPRPRFSSSGWWTSSPASSRWIAPRSGR